ncbi:glycosyltransferase [Rhizobiales bacterium]|uniref:glycosyltransferase family 2 protein n=1 Tax=Hongsoonwoonella zoysiae TaxID=2821844 RepID=UPI001560B450|nr:glycosyltransferase [Hongsoonwoonella zoysiae]NRG18538.1 glycosyltransferase [Hongsoonwoonella zoysiae]
MANWNSLHQFGYDALGPIVNAYLLRLHSYLLQCDEKDDKVLFCLRAGLRIQELYETWLTARSTEAPVDVELLGVSRMMAIKAAYCFVPNVATTALGREFSDCSLDQIIRSILNKEITSGRCPEFAPIDQMPLHKFLKRNDRISEYVNNYLHQQSKIYTEYLARIAGDAKRIILVDSGWKGTSQLLLKAAYSNYEWEGLYFGCIGRAQIFDRQPGIMHGLIFDSQTFRSNKPETAFTIHRHVIESLFEAGIPSFDHIEAKDIYKKIDRSEFLKTEIKEKWDEVYLGVLDYIRSNASDSVYEITTNYHQAVKLLSSAICYPTLDDIFFVSGKSRSLDLGRSGAVDAVMPARDRFDGDSKALRVAEAIWPTAQARVEYPEEEVEKHQRRIVTEYTDGRSSEYFVANEQMGGAIGSGPGHVAIITRTKDRPVLLERAAKSVAEQTYENYTWVIVNDGGDIGEVLRVIGESSVDPTKIRICSNSRSLGMEAASNVGIYGGDSEYIVIHDDDDSWHCDFLKQTVEFLTSNSHVYDGVITKTTYVSEEISGNTIIEHGRFPYNDWIRDVQLSEMIVGNFFAPIAFLFRRRVLEEIGGFDETLPVLGDWDFNLRFLMKANIGVLPKHLAFYHHRDRGSQAGTYSNSVIGGIDRHAEYNAIVRNKYIRRAATDDEFAALGNLMALGFTQSDTRSRLNNVRITGTQTGGAPHVSPVGHVIGDPDECRQAMEGLQAELDERWIMLHQIADKLIKAKKMKVSAIEIIGSTKEEIKDYLKKNKIHSPPDFDDESYLRKYADVSDSVSKGQFASGFDHYVKHGKNEGRNRPKI